MIKLLKYLILNYDERILEMNKDVSVRVPDQYDVMWLGSFLPVFLPLLFKPPDTFQAESSGGEVKRAQAL